MQQKGIAQPERGYEEVPVQGAGRSETGALSEASRELASRELFREAWSGPGLATDPKLETAEQKIKFEQLLVAQMALAAAGIAPAGPLSGQAVPEAAENAAAVHAVSDDLNEDEMERRNEVRVRNEVVATEDHAVIAGIAQMRMPGPLPATPFRDFATE